MIVIDEMELKTLLQKHKNEIGVTVHECVNDGIALAGLIFGTFQFMEKSRLWLVLGVVCVTALGIYDWRRWHMAKKEKFNAEKLGNEINGLDKTEHRHSLLAIKDTCRDYPLRFLVYYDKAWRCWLLPNYDTMKKDDVSASRQRLSDELKIPMDSITLEEKACETYPKFSPKVGRMKYYAHTLYEAHVDTFPDYMREETFTIAGTSFRWMTLRQMEQDSEIQKKNMDVVDMLKHCII